MLNQAEESAVVQGADGLLYVVADKSDKEQLISSDTPQIAEKTEGDFTADLHRMRIIVKPIQNMKDSIQI